MCISAARHVIPFVVACCFCCGTAIAPLRAASDDDGKAVDLARQILDEGTSAAKRRSLVADNPGLALPIAQAMVRDMPVGTDEEYRRIPWIWRVSVAAGRRNDAAEIKGFLDWALPRSDEPLHDWAVVVLAGGMVSGLSDTVAWPRERIEEIIADSDDLQSRWNRAIDLASQKADDESVPTPTRYDALRMIAMHDWDRRGGQLFRYLAEDVHPEVQQGALSGLGDMHAAPVAQALLSGVEHYSPESRSTMLNALIRDESRIPALLDAIAAGRLDKSALSEEQLGKLKAVDDDQLRQRVESQLDAPGK